MASVKRARIQAVSSTVGDGGAGVSVFGFAHTPAATIKKVCVATEADSFKKLLEQTNKRWVKQRDEHAGAAAEGRRLCTLSDAKRQAVVAACAKKRARASRSALFGSRRLAWRSILRQSGGQSPFVCVLDIADRPTGFLDRDCGGQPLRDIAVTDLKDWLSQAIAPQRRVLLVTHIESVGWHALLAAMVCGAHVREDLQVPLVQYKMLPRCVMAFTGDFARSHPQVVQIARTAAAMTYRFGLQDCKGDVRGQHERAQAPFLCRRLADVYNELRHRARRGGEASWIREYTIMYIGEGDSALAEMPRQAKAVARLFSEFLSQFGKVR